MRRIVAVVGLGLVMAACSGGGVNSYEDGIKAQSKAVEDLIGVLKGVDDQASAEAAVAKIEKLGDRLAEIAQQMAELPKPSPEELRQLAEQQMAKPTELLGQSSDQLRKLGEYPVLADAWTRAMAKLK